MVRGIELDKFHTPDAIRFGPVDAPVNTLGIRRIMFAVDDIDACRRGCAPTGPSSSEKCSTGTRTGSPTSGGPRGSLSGWPSNSAEACRSAGPRITDSNPVPIPETWIRLSSVASAFARSRRTIARDLRVQSRPRRQSSRATLLPGAEDFQAHWKTVLADSNVVARAIVVGDRLAGSISCFQREGLRYVGYWVSQDFWGQGVASKALELLLNEVSSRPLHAQSRDQQSGLAPGAGEVRIRGSSVRYLACR